MGDCIGALLAYETMCQDQWGSASSCDTNPSNPVSPLSQRDKHFDTNLLVNDQSMRSPRLSNSDLDIRGPQYNHEVDFPKRAYSMGSKKSASVEDGLDLGSHKYAVPLPSKVKKLEFDVSKFFAFGSPIGLVLLHKRLSSFSHHNSSKC